MSSILKALKKLESEKTSRKSEPLDIDREILRSDNAVRPSLAGVSLAVGFVFLCGSAITYVYMKHSGAPSAPPAAVRAGTSAAATAVTDSSPQDSNVPAALPQPGQASPGHTRSSSGTGERPSAPLPRNTTAVYATTAPSAQPAAPAEEKQPTETGEHAVSPAAQAASAGTTPLVKVNGIAFQGDGTGSVAVVNGVQVVDGSMVEGVRVEDIQKDRVRFSYGGEQFEVRLGTSNR